MMDDIASKALSANSSNHDAAVVLATPEFSRHLHNEEFMSSMAVLLAGSSSPIKFHVLGAIVDYIAPQLGVYQTSPGISVLRGHLDQMLPNLWQEEPKWPVEDIDTVSALSFSIGVPQVTLPLARTMFHNNRASTLVASAFDISGGVARMEQQLDRYSQQVFVADNDLPQNIGKLGLWAPLVPLTQPRLISASFGNIVRGVKIDDQSIPASTELEDAVNSFYTRSKNSSAARPGPVGIWALVTPRSDSPNTATSWLNSCSMPLSVSSTQSTIQELTIETAAYLHKSHKRGARLLKVCT